MGKLKEAILAVKIAQTQDKDTVLCNYLNTIYLGRSAYGIQTAAQAYFGKDAKDLTVPEAAMLAGIIPSPSNWDPAVNAKQAKSRFERVINIMKEDGYITAKQAREATMPKTVTNAQQTSTRAPTGICCRWSAANSSTQRRSRKTTSTPAATPSSPPSTNPNRI